MLANSLEGSSPLKWLRVGLKNVFGPSVSYREREPGVPVIHTNTILTKKAPDHEGRVRLKARLVALGNQEPLDPEERTASPTIIPALIKIMATVGLTRQLEERGSGSYHSDRVRHRYCVPQRRHGGQACCACVGLHYNQYRVARVSS